MWEEWRKTGWDSQWEVFLWVTMCERKINLQGLLVHQSLAERNVSAALEKENACEGKRREMSVHCLASYYTAQALICIPLQLMLSRMILPVTWVMMVMTLMMMMMGVSMTMLAAMMCVLAIMHIQTTFTTMHISSTHIDCQDTTRKKCILSSLCATI